MTRSSRRYTMYFDNESNDEDRSHIAMAVWRPP